MTTKKIPPPKKPTEPLKLAAVDIHDSEAIAQLPPTNNPDEVVLPGGGEVGGPGLVETIASTLEVDKNKQTGSTFYVIGEDDDVKAAVRFWREASSPEITVIGHRLRLTPKIDVASFPHYMAAKYPAVQWVGSSGSHVSVAGATAFKVPSHHYDKVLALVEENSIPQKLLEHVKASFPGLEFRLTDEQFVAFYYEELRRILNVQEIKQHVPSAVVFNFGATKLKLEGGQEVDTAAEDVGL